MHGIAGFLRWFAVSITTRFEVSNGCAVVIKSEIGRSKIARDVCAPTLVVYQFINENLPLSSFMGRRALRTSSFKSPSASPLRIINGCNVGVVNR